jgi:peptide deformylase
MILKIEIGQNNPILRKKSLEIKEINSDIQKLANDMIETMNKNNGVGLATNQIGKNIRIFVIAKEVSKKQVFINPEIIKISNKTEKSEEGCLSLPNVFLKIKRAKSLKIKAIDERGKEFKLKAKGLLAHAIQHELDHLNGVLILDKNENS